MKTLVSWKKKNLNITYGPNDLCHHLGPMWFVAVGGISRCGSGQGNGDGPLMVGGDGVVVVVVV
jgi:hypothetical protein